MPAIAAGFDGDDESDVSDCPECGAEVYLIADRCPKCGYWFEDGDREGMRRSRQLHSEMRLVKIGGAILLALMAIGLIVLGLSQFAG
jgi:uncharacterized membrane protein YvbJ